MHFVDQSYHTVECNLYGEWCILLLHFTDLSYIDTWSGQYWHKCILFMYFADNCDYTVECDFYRRFCLQHLLQIDQRHIRRAFVLDRPPVWCVPMVLGAQSDRCASVGHIYILQCIHKLHKLGDSLLLLRNHCCRQRGLRSTHSHHDDRFVCRYLLLLSLLSLICLSVCNKAAALTLLTRTATSSYRPMSHRWPSR